MGLLGVVGIERFTESYQERIFLLHHRCGGCVGHGGHLDVMLDGGNLSGILNALSDLLGRHDRRQHVLNHVRVGRGRRTNVTADKKCIRSRPLLIRSKVAFAGKPAGKTTSSNHSRHVRAKSRHHGRFEEADAMFREEWNRETK